MAAATFSEPHGRNPPAAPGPAGARAWGPEISASKRRGAPACRGRPGLRDRCLRVAASASPELTGSLTPDRARVALGA
jgi:hypothetical protein